MKLYKKIIIVLVLLIFFVYVCNISLFPDNIILMQGEKLKLNTIFGLEILSDTTMQASSNLNNSIMEDSGTEKLTLNLFNFLPVKDLTVNVIPTTTVVPIGKAIGMKLYTEGVLVVGMSEINGEKPYEGSGIEAGDKIIEINNEEINNTDELIECVNRSKGESLDIKYISNNEEKMASIEPVQTAEDEYKLGLWVRDAAAGVGTLTFYEPSTGNFAALGHGINDVDTYKLIDIANGELVTTNIIGIVKGVDGAPGEIKGTVENGRTLGRIEKNTAFGVYGKLSSNVASNVSFGEEMEVANRSEIKTGKAEIMCELENGKVQNYEIEIKKTFKENNENNKSMLIEITDKELLEKTGGIIQGMSGAPIIQNGKFIGAVTHVLVNDSAVGYAVFADMMIKQMREVE